MMALRIYLYIDISIFLHSTEHGQLESILPVLIKPPVFVEGPAERTSAEAGEASEHEPLRQQEERSREHAGYCPTDG